MDLKTTNFKLLAYLDLHDVEINYYVKPGSHRTVIGEYADSPRNRELTDRYETPEAVEFPAKELLRKYVNLTQKSRSLIMTGGF
jgi:hypothetical protein